MPYLSTASFSTQLNLVKCTTEPGGLSYRARVTHNIRTWLDMTLDFATLPTISQNPKHYI